MREHAALIFREAVRGDNSVFRQLSKGWRRALACLGAGLAAFGVTYLIAQAAGEPVCRLTRDLAAITGSRLYIGFLSNAGIILWSAATAIWFFGAHLGHRSIRSDWARFFTATGAISLYLTLDDVYMFHDELFPQYLHLHEFIVYATYLIGISAWVLAFSVRIFETDYLFLVLAFFFFGMSMGMDLLPFGNVETFVEDCLKFTGIVCWLTYGFRTVGAFAAARETDQDTSRSPAESADIRAA